jgi:hypothetical protein
MANIIERAAWGAKAPSGSRNALNASPEGTTLHWEGPKMGSRPHAQCAALVRSIQAFHMGPQRGWSDIAYSLLVCEHGYVFVGRGRGIGSAANGTTDANRRRYAICALVGQGDPITPALIQGIKDAHALCVSWGAKNAMNGHRDWIATTCPGQWLYEQVRKGAFLKVGVTRVIAKPASRATTAVRQAISAKPILRRGSKGTAVRRLQQGLRTKFPAYARIAVDGDFGPATDRAVREFQRRSGLAADGVVGARTWAALGRYGIKP